jgi:hypothetical protein
MKEKTRELFGCMFVYYLIFAFLMWDYLWVSNSSWARWIYVIVLILQASSIYDEDKGIKKKK